MLYTRIFQGLVVITGILWSATHFAQSANSLNYNIVVTKKAPAKVLANSITYAQYKITNKSQNTLSMRLNPVKGMKQIINNNLCPANIRLKPAESCRLNLELDADKMDAHYTRHAIKFSSKNCIKPNKKAFIHMEILPCKKGKCLSEDKTSELRQVSAAFKDQHHIPGMVVGIWTDKGALVIEDGLAEIKNQIPINRRDHFRIASLTKTFTVTVLLQMAEQHLLNIHDQLEQYISWMQNGKATLAQLADMRSGIFNYTEDPTVIKNLMENPTMKLDPAQIMKDINHNPPYFSPQSNQWHYSNSNTILLGLIIEHIVGKPLGAEIQERLLTPLKLDNTFYPETPEMPKPYAHAYIKTDDGFIDVTSVHPTASAGSGAMISRLDDLHQWAIALVQGKLDHTTVLHKTLQEQRLNSLEKIQYSPCADEQKDRKPADCPMYDAYGLGIGSIASPKQKIWFGHTAEYLGYEALIMHEPQSQSTIVILMNTAGVPDMPARLFKQYLNVLEK